MSTVKVCGVLEMCSDATPKTVYCNATGDAGTVWL